MTAKRILVIDNEQYIREVGQICLETVAGWEVLTWMGDHLSKVTEIQQADIFPLFC